MTKRQQIVLRMLKEDFLIQAEIARRLKISRPAVCKIIKRLRNKGLLDNYSNPTKKGVLPSDPLKAYQQIRLHNQRLSIRILINSKFYMRLLKQNNTLNMDNNTIKLYRKCLVIYSNNSFFGKDAEEADAKSLKYWFKIIHRLQNQFKITLLKDRYTNIKVTNSHYANIENDLAIQANKRKQYIRIKADDNKTWLLTDNSFNLNELETVHPETAYHDMQQTILPFMKTLHKNPKVLDHLQLHATQMTQIVDQLTINQKKIIDFIMPQQPPTEPEYNKTIPDYIS